MNTKQQTPIAKFKAGNVAVAIWENKIGNDTVLKVTVQKQFQDKQGNWKSSGSFARNEIPLAVFCLQEAFKEIIDRQNRQSQQESQEAENVIL